MADRYRDDVDPAGCLVFRSRDQPDFERSYYIYPHCETDIGRSFIDEMLGFEDRTISKHHLRIRCIGYDNDVDSKVTPLIYARVLSSNTAILKRHGFDDRGNGIELGRDQGDVLLNPGDHLRLTNKVSIDLASMDQKPESADFDEVREVERELFADQFRLSKRILGAGGYASVYVAVKQKTNQQFACKIMSVPINPEDIEDEPHQTSRRNTAALKRSQEKVAREYNLLKDLSHPNIISLEKVIRTSYNIYIFQELVTGGDLLSYLDNKGALEEPQAAIITRQLLEAVKYLHENQVVHRDIKPENILMTSWKDGCRVVLTDFGHSRTIKDVEHAAKKAGVFRMQSMVGTSGYTAPEVYWQMRKDLQDGSGYSQAIDIWSIGCVTAILLTNEHLFPDAPDLRANDVAIPHLRMNLSKLDNDRRWQSIGHRAKSFIRGCLATDENKRLTAKQCLALEWFQHPHYKAEFDAAYKHAIADWRPREYDDDVVEFIDTSHIRIAREPTPEEDTRSRHFDEPPPDRPFPEDLDSMVSRFRPGTLNASPVRRRQSIVDEYGDFDEGVFDELVDQQLSLASQNATANIAALQAHARLPPPLTQRKMVFR